MAKRREIKEGDKYGRLTILKIAPSRNYKRRVVCECECGVVKEYCFRDLTSGNTKSCGCLSRELVIQRNNSYPEELVKSRLYTTWNSMKNRCYTKSSSGYKKYGAKGIRICNEWKENFITFYNWAITHGYSDGLTIDRIDYTGNYEPSNCRWIPAKEQASNKSSVKLITFQGETHNIPEWSEIIGIDYKSLYYRIHSGWSIEKALTTPYLRKRNNLLQNNHIKTE